MTILEQLVIDLGTAPTGRVDVDSDPIRIRTMSEHMNPQFIEIVAKHLVKLGYKRMED